MKGISPCSEFQNFTDSQLLEAMLRDDAAHSCIYLRHKSYCINFILSKGASEDDALDIYQDATIVLYEKVRQPSFKLTCTIQTYLNSICFYQLLARNKGSYNKKIVLTEEVDENYQDWFEENTEMTEEKMNIVLSAFKELQEKGDKCYERLRLFYYENLSMDAIAIRLGLTNADSAKVQVYKCRTLLKKMLDHRK